MRHWLRVAVIGAGGMLAALLLLRGFAAGGAIAAAIGTVMSVGVDWLLGAALGEDRR